MNRVQFQNQLQNHQRTMLLNQCRFENRQQLMRSIQYHAAVTSQSYQASCHAASARMEKAFNDARAQQIADSNRRAFVAVTSQYPYTSSSSSSSEAAVEDCCFCSICCLITSLGSFGTGFFCLSPSSRTLAYIGGAISASISLSTSLIACSEYSLLPNRSKNVAVIPSEPAVFLEISSSISNTDNRTENCCRKRCSLVNSITSFVLNQLSNCITWFNCCYPKNAPKQSDECFARMDALERGFQNLER